jgi:hypothetical protein
MITEEKLGIIYDGRIWTNSKQTIYNDTWVSIYQLHILLFFSPFHVKPKERYCDCGDQVFSWFGWSIFVLIEQVSKTCFWI